MDKVPNALPHRSSIEIEIYGVEGIPEEDQRKWELVKAGKGKLNYLINNACIIKKRTRGTYLSTEGLYVPSIQEPQLTLFLFLGHDCT